MESKPPPSAGALIGGIAAGLFAGGIVIWIVTGIIFALIFQAIKATSSNNNLPFILNYVLAVGIGASSIFLRNRNWFMMGFLIGACIGMLGSTAVCNVVVTGLSNSH